MTASIENKYELLCAALSAEPIENQWINEYENLLTQNIITENPKDTSQERKNSFENINKNYIYRNYADLCFKESQINNLISYRTLNEVLDDLRKIANNPGLFNNVKGALGGGFSGGKSSFVNSFIEDKSIHLPIGIKPITAIPTYIISNSEKTIKAVSPQQGLFTLPSKLHKGIDHDFLVSMPFLKKVISYITISTPLDSSLFKNISLIDTPGYNPAQTGTKQKDMEVAAEYIKNADFLLWIIGLDSGTIPDSDFDFLDMMEFGYSKPLYVVANKADLKTTKEINETMEEFNSQLIDRGINVEGISAFSSKYKKEYTYIKKSLFDFFKDMNQFNSVLNENWKDKITYAFSIYIQGIIQESKETDIYLGKIHKTLLDLYRDDVIDDCSELEETLSDLKKHFLNKGSLDQRINSVIVLRDEFIRCIDNFCKEQNISHNEKKRFCMGCGYQLKSNEDSCPKCYLHKDGQYKVCPKCNNQIQLFSKFCSFCGQAITN